MNRKVKKGDFKEDIKSDKGLIDPLKRILKKKSDKKKSPKKNE